MAAARALLGRSRAAPLMPASSVLPLGAHTTGLSRPLHCSTPVQHNPVSSARIRPTAMCLPNRAAVCARPVHCSTVSTRTFAHHAVVDTGTRGWRHQHQHQRGSGSSWWAGALGCALGAAAGLGAVALADDQPKQVVQYVDIPVLPEKYPEWMVANENPEQIIYQDQIFPLVVSPARNMTREEFLEAVRKDSDWVHAALKKYGAIIFRGFPLEDAQAFDALVHCFGLTELPYVGGAAPRHVVTGAVFTTNESPPNVYIPFHHEMAQVEKHPHKLFFFCETPPAAGGQTSIVPSWLVYNEVKAQHPDYVTALEDLGVRYTRVMPSEDDNSSAQGRSWKSTYLTEDKQVAEQKCVESGNTFKWVTDPDGQECMSVTSRTLPAIKHDERTGRKVWFNSLLAAHPNHGWLDVRNDPAKACVLGNGEPFDQEFVTDVLRIMRRNRASITWQAGDVMMIDNRTVMHSRETFDPPRRVLASLWVDSPQTPR